MSEQILQAAMEEAERLKVYAIGRIQLLREISVVVNNRKTERIVSEDTCGIGMQVFTEAGFSGFASSDQLSLQGAIRLVQKAANLAKLSQTYGGQPNRQIFSVPKLIQELDCELQYPWDKVTLPEIENLVNRENELALELAPGFSLQTAFRQVIEHWQIARSDGTRVRFSLPRAALVHSITARREKRTVSTRCALGGKDLGLLLDVKLQTEGRARCRNAAQLALDLLGAKPLKGGHYKLVIDYALAKGLAHEAFGHAVETDAVKTSILADQGKLSLGMEVAAPIVSIIDGPLSGDWAYQPVSANGVIRETIKIVDQGKLTAGLGDVFSAQQAGVPLSGAGRAEGFDHIPLPRMTNIRIETANPLPLAKPWYEVTPRDLYQLLLNHGLISQGEEVYYLVGYKGGQVNIQHGDFVFNCSAVYRLGDQPELYQPGIFAGKTLSALKSIQAGIGPLLTDALGTCGKWGQGVSSSGGSTAFLVLAANPEITLGGE